MNRETVEKVREMFEANVLYLEYEPETEKYGGDIVRKWGNAVMHVETEYTQVCTDKEFVIPTTSCKCIGFLMKNPDYATAEGMNYQLYHQYNINVSFFPWNGKYSIPYDKVFDRLMKHCDSTSQFSVYNTSVMRQTHELIDRYQIFDIRIGETAAEVLKIMIGKAKKYVDIPGNIRDLTSLPSFPQLNNLKVKTESSFARYPHLYEYPKDIYDTLLDNLSNCLYELLIDEIESLPIDFNIKEWANNLIKNRYGVSKYHHPLLQNYLFQIIWEVIPIHLRYIISARFGEASYEKWVPRRSVTDEMKCINKITNIYRSHYKKDKSIL